MTDLYEHTAVGDPAPHEPVYVLPCMESDPDTGFICTRPSHVAGWQHIAHDGTQVLAVWFGP